jgi:hypothetical protein
MGTTKNQGTSRKEEFVILLMLSEIAEEKYKNICYIAIWYFNFYFLLIFHLPIKCSKH